MKKIQFRLHYIFFALIFIFCEFNTSTLAYDKNFYAQNDIVWYDPTGGCSGGSNSGITAPGSCARLAEIRQEMTQGLSDSDRDMIFKTVFSETSVNPDSDAGKAKAQAHIEEFINRSYGGSRSIGQQISKIPTYYQEFCSTAKPWKNCESRLSQYRSVMIEIWGIVLNGSNLVLGATDNASTPTADNTAKTNRVICGMGNDDTTCRTDTYGVPDNISGGSQRGIEYFFNNNSTSDFRDISSSCNGSNDESIVATDTSVPSTIGTRDTVDWVSGIDGLSRGNPEGVASSGGGGQEFGSGQPSKIVLHSTEGTSLVNDYIGGQAAPHFTVDLLKKQGHQHFPLNKTSGALKAKDGDAIQIEIVGFVTKNSVAGANSSYVMFNIPDDGWDYLAKYLIEINKQTNIPLTSTLNWNNANPDDNHQTTDVRLTDSAWNSFRGVAGHMHVPSNDHWDPGPIWSKVQAAISRAGGATNDTNTSSSCVSGSPGDSSGLSGIVLSNAWKHKCQSNGTGCTEQDSDESPNRTNAMTQKEAYAANRPSYYKGGCNGNDCGGWVTYLMRESGWDSDYNSSNGNTTWQQKYVRESDQWECVWNKGGDCGGSTGDVQTEADLRPGDVYFTPGHTYAYVGDIEGFGSKIASASQCQRAPTAGTEALLPNNGNIYRMKK